MLRNLTFVVQFAYNFRIRPKKVFVFLATFEQLSSQKQLFYCFEQLFEKLRETLYVYMYDFIPVPQTAYTFIYSIKRSLTPHVLDSVTDMLSSLKWRSLELRRSDARLCMLYKQCNGLATYERDKLPREHKSGMNTRQSSLWHRFKEPHCTIKITLGQLHSGTISHQKLQHLLRHVHFGNSCVILHIDQ